jgi:dephospho-CoA kinase
MHVVGIVGGIASGKSLVTQELARLGAEVINADKLGHEVLKEPEVIAQARERWGDRIIGSDGHINRRAVAEIVFGTEPQAAQELQYLEDLTHPRISVGIRDRISQLAAQGAVDVVALDAALLLEAGWHEYCDSIVFVDAPEAVRLERARQRGWSQEQFLARETAQWPVALKRGKSTVVIDNSGSVSQTVEQIQEFWSTLPHFDA